MHESDIRYCGVQLYVCMNVIFFMYLYSSLTESVDGRMRRRSVPNQGQSGQLERRRLEAARGFAASRQRLCVNLQKTLLVDDEFGHL